MIAKNKPKTQPKSDQERILNKIARLNKELLEYTDPGSLAEIEADLKCARARLMFAR